MKNKANIQAAIGQRIRQLRRLKGLTQQELGERAGINYKFLGEIERGLQNPTVQTIYKIATALETDLCEVVRIEEEKKDRQAVEASISQIIHDLPEEELRQLLTVLKVFFPVNKGK